jgi:hypothetical protein
MAQPSCVACGAPASRRIHVARHDNPPQFAGPPSCRRAWLLVNQSTVSGVRCRDCGKRLVLPIASIPSHSHESNLQAIDARQSSQFIRIRQDRAARNLLARRVDHFRVMGGGHLARALCIVVLSVAVMQWSSWTRFEPGSRWHNSRAAPRRAPPGRENSSGRETRNHSRQTCAAAPSGAASPAVLC